jgi:two-component system cell cycle response regulator DivK
MTQRILVVEDNDLNRKLFCDVLQASGFDVEPVADGGTAIERARSIVPNLVIMDIQLQDISGLDLIAGMKDDLALCDIPVLAVTAYAGMGDVERIRQVGAEGYLAKPVSIVPFMNAVKGLLDRSAAATPLPLHA